MKICIISSVGGHLTEVLQLKDIYMKYDFFFVINDKRNISEEINERAYFITHSERDWKFLINLYEAFNIFRKERPNVILSTGAGPAVPVSLVGKFFGCSIIFIESFAAVERPTLTGRIMYYIADKFFYQWEKLGKYYPKGIYGGSIF